MRMVEFSRVVAASFALLWLTGRKRPGKICRGRQFWRFHGPDQSPGRYELSNDVNLLISKPGVARGSHG
jgi:hypothetical protein